MPQYQSLMEITKAEWLQAMKLPEADIPDVVIVEGSWWRQQRTDWRLGYLADVHELEFPDIFWGRWVGEDGTTKKVVYCCAYGAARVVEIIHLFGVLGCKLAVQIGTCGGLQPQLKTGDIILPTAAIGREGVAHLYGAVEAALGTPAWIDQADQQLRARQHTIERGTHLTWSSIFAQNGEMINEWHQAGYLSVDMETATTFAVAAHYGMPAVSMLVVWDDILHGRSFLDPLSEDELAALDKANESVYEVALALSEKL